MTQNRFVASLGCLTAMLALTAACGAQPDQALRVVAIDVEGGAATLYITPQGHSLLIDAGWPAGMGGRRPAPGAPPASDNTPSSAQRIASVVKGAGLTRIDYLLISHYHTDHVGGAVELMGLVPVGTVIDHGPNREEIPAGASPRAIEHAPATLYPQYLAAIGTRPHRSLRPGESLKLDAATFTAIDSDGVILTSSLPGAGAAGAGCAAVTSNDDIGGEENARSLGVLVHYGRARILSLADSTWNLENTLVCPRNLIGSVDLMFADNHGSDNANSPVLVNSVQPRVVVFGNGPAKGAGAQSVTTALASPRIQAVWQLHFAEEHPEQNAPQENIANLAGAADAMNPVRIEVSTDGTLRLSNPRTGRTARYDPR